jgi:hypothetical protein
MTATSPAPLTPERLAALEAEYRATVEATAHGGSAEDFAALAAWIPALVGEIGRLQGALNPALPATEGNGMAAFAGAWPGEESEGELLATLDVLDGKGESPDAALNATLAARERTVEALRERLTEAEAMEGAAARFMAAVSINKRDPSPTAQRLAAEAFDGLRDLWAARLDAAMTAEIAEVCDAALAASGAASPAADGAIVAAARAFRAAVGHTVVLDGPVEDAWDALCAAMDGPGGAR